MTSVEISNTADHIRACSCGPPSLKTLTLFAFMFKSPVLTLRALLKKDTPGDTAREGADDDDLPPRPLMNLEKRVTSEGFSDLGGIVRGIG